MYLRNTVLVLGASAILVAGGLAAAWAEPFEEDGSMVASSGVYTEGVYLDPDEGVGPHGFGTDDLITYWLPAASFNPWESATQWGVYGAGYISKFGAASGWFWAPIDLPHGAYIYSMRMYFYDNTDLAIAEARIRYYQGGSATTVASVQSSNVGGAGSAATMVWQTLNNFPEGNNTTERFYLAELYLPNNTDVRFLGMRIWWRRQISPAPASPSFTDVPTGHWAYQHVEALVASGITAGCGGGNYCPEATLTRAQMAVFLAKALGLHWAVP